MRHLAGVVFALALNQAACTGRPVVPLRQVEDDARPGHAWRQVLSGTTGVLHHVWGSGPADVYVTGNIGVMQHCDGDRCSRVALPGAGSYPNLAVGGSGTDDVWAVGSYWLFHYDGSSWHRFSENPLWSWNPLVSVWAPSRDRAYFTQEKGTILHFDGKRFTSAKASKEYLAMIWGSSPSDIFAVGERGAVVHYDGTSWSPMKSNTGVYLIYVWGSGPTDVFAVGDKGVIIHYDGQHWTRQHSGVSEKLMAVWGTGPNEVYAAGLPNAFLRYDGTRWSKTAIGWKDALGLPSSACISGLWGTDASNIYAVGTPGLILHYTHSGDGGP